MLFSSLIIIISFVFLYLINYFQIKNNFCLDESTNKESHKTLLNFEKKVSLSGSFYFLPIILYLTFDHFPSFSIACALFFCIGLLSDLKILDSPKVRLLLQFFILVIFLFFNQDLLIDTRISLFNYLIQYEYLRILIISFFFF